MKKRINSWIAIGLYKFLCRRETKALKKATKATKRMEVATDELRAATAACLEYSQKIVMYAAAAKGRDISGTGDQLPGSDRAGY